MTSAKTVSVRFVQDYTVQDERVGTPDEETYKKGDRKALVPTSAAHFVNRQIAVYIGAAKQA